MFPKGTKGTKGDNALQPGVIWRDPHVSRGAPSPPRIDAPLCITPPALSAGLYRIGDVDRD